MNPQPSQFELWPEAASTLAGRIDALFWFEFIVALLFGALIAALITIFIVAYRRRSDADRPLAPRRTHAIEITWTLIPGALVMVFFFWGADIYVDAYTPPSDALEVFVVGKQWMWKVQHPEGKREINELHVPLGQRVKLTMTSEDVIHSFYVPAFRLKRDVVPGRYIQQWFEATKVGQYHLFCAEYCGTEHSRMLGKVTVLEPADYLAWLSGSTDVSMPAAGQELFRRHGCIGCHSGDSGARGPDLKGVYGKQVQLAGGDTVVADETYLRESIVRPGVRLVAGYAAVMPAFQGQISEEGLAQLIAYIRSIGAPAGAPGGANPAAPAAPAAVAPPTQEAPR